MPSLRQLLASHPTLLLADTCSTRVEVALWRSDSLHPAAVSRADAEASSGLPSAIQQVLAETGLTVRDLSAAVFCSGPGSVLGIRLAAATLRTWRALRPDLALYAYASLPLLSTAHPDLTIVADARRDSWHAVRIHTSGALERVPSTQLPALAAKAPLGTPSTFRSWSKLPADIVFVPLEYSASHLLSTHPDADLLAPSPEPDAFMHETPAYVTWTPRVHQAPSVASPHTPAA